MRQVTHPISLVSPCSIAHTSLGTLSLSMYVCSHTHTQSCLSETVCVRLCLMRGIEKMVHQVGERERKRERESLCV
jgi:hypothetical protein